VTAERRSVPTRREALRITAVAGIGLALGGAGIAELLRRARLHRVRVTRTQLGTAVTVTVIHTDVRLAADMVERAFAEMERLEEILSRHRPGTPVHRLNRTGRLTGAPPELLAVLGHALDCASLTDGAFDVTMAPLLELYTSCFATRGRPPSDAEVAATLERVGWRGLRIDHDSVTFELPGMAVTLDGIAKGYVVDRAVAILAAAGADRVLVDAGGDMAAGGTSVDEPWRVAIRHPRDARDSLGVLEFGAGSVASSGDYVQSFTPDRRFHHILDPRTGRSPDHTSAVTVVAHTAMAADALSTAVFVLGPAAGVALLDRLGGVAGMVVTKNGAVRTSTGFDAFAAHEPGRASFRRGDNTKSD
jgi:thiamine biosynthesis lipoprotein